jgi:hypothetical protein
MENANDFNLESQEKLDENKVEDTVKTVKKNNKIGPFIAALVVLLGISAVAIAFTIVKKDSGLSKPQVTSTVTEDKDEISDDAFEAIAWCNMCGIIVGRDDNKVHAKDVATRAELATILVRLDEAL